MEDMYRKLFSRLTAIDAPATLTAAIIARVHFEERRHARRRLALFGTLSLLSVGSLVEAIIHLVASATSSGFLSYVAMLVSDISILMSYPREIGLTLVESLPVAATILLLSTIALFIWSSTRTLRDTHISFAHA